MNHSYVGYGNDYIVSDESGNMKVVNMNNSSIKARDIFDAENKLESLNLEFDDCILKQDLNNKKLIAGRIIGLANIIGVSILFFAFFPPVMPFMVTLGIVGTYFLCLKALSICCFGTLIGGLIKRKSLSSRIITLGSEITSLEKKLDKMKKDTHYDDKTIEAPSNTDNHSYSFDKKENNSIESSSNTDIRLGEYSFDKTDNKPKVYILSNGKKVN